ncbi:MAG: hypothetical protein ACOC80_05090 [Petrotogales bacterium]
MKRTKQYKTKMKHGIAGYEQERKWDDTLVERVYRLALLGLTNEEISVAFGVHPRTINRWMEYHPEFAKAIRLGREEADSKVAECLYKKAVGYKKKEIYIALSKDGEIVEHEYEKEMVPDTTAQIFWLKNRQKEKWADVWKMEHTGHIDMAAQKNQLDDLSDEELEILKKYSIIQQIEKNKDNANE